LLLQLLNYSNNLIIITPIDMSSTNVFFLFITQIDIFQKFTTLH